MVESSKVSQEIIQKLHLVQEFLDDVYDGKQQYRARIAFISNTLNDVIIELEDKQS